MPSQKIEIICPDCSGLFHRLPHSINKAIKNSGLWRCKVCMLKKRNHAHVRPLMSRRRKGKCIEIKTNNGWMFEHRYIMQQHIGRELYPDEVVHHKNQKRNDNRLVNLEIMRPGEHTKLHHTGAKRSEETKRKIKEGKKKNYIYENHGSYQHITTQDLKVSYFKFKTVAKASKRLGITRRTFYNKLKHFNLTLEGLCQE